MYIRNEVRKMDEELQIDEKREQSEERAVEMDEHEEAMCEERRGNSSRIKLLEFTEW